MALTTQINTAQQLLEAGDIGRCELLRGELIMMSPAGSEHGRITVDLTILLGMHVQQHDLGILWVAETGFLVNRDPDTVRAPDIAFVSRQRAAIANTKGFVTEPPDLVVEVLSPDDRTGGIQAKVQDWLTFGCKLVWIIDPKTRTVTVYRSSTMVVVLDAGDELTGGDVVPGFVMKVADIFGESLS